MKNHIFTKTNNTWNIRCLKTNGEFNTIVWLNGKVKGKLCPCCNEEIQNEKNIST